MDQSRANVGLESSGTDDENEYHAPIWSRATRPYNVTELSPHADKKSSLAIPRSRFPEHYMWAKLFQNEDTRGVGLVSLGQFTVVCPNQHCKATFWESERLYGSAETPFWCCGKTVRTRLTGLGIFKPIVDEYIKELYEGNSADAINFQTNIRIYNEVLSTAVPVVQYGTRRSRGGRTLTVNGRVTFEADIVPDLHTDGLPRNPGQLYFVDMCEDVVNRRVERTVNPDIRPHIVEALERYLRAHNDFVRTFELASLIQKTLDPESDDRVALIVNPHRAGLRTTDRSLFQEDDNIRRPEGSECVAGVYVGANLRYPHYDIIYYPKERQPDSRPVRGVHEASPSIDLMLYPLIHLHAEDPWIEVDVPRARIKRPRLEENGQSTCGTLREYYSCRLMARELNESGVLFKSRGLFQQYVCDASLKIMDNNLRYIESHQDELQVCHFDSLKRFVEREAERIGKHPGRVVMIPRKEQRSERRMYNNYMDAVRIAVEFGTPCFFFTFTTNPRWPEIVEQLASRGLRPDEYAHAPDIVVRVFLARLGVFLSDVIAKAIFGVVTAYVGVHEFTTTMLPHFHLAVIMNPGDEVDVATDLDGLVVAEIPNRETDPELYDLVTRLMVHRPCDGSSPGYDNPSCRDGDGKCRHGFPKQFRDTTAMTRSGFEVRRRNTGSFWHAKYKCFIDNRWIVLYSPKCLVRHGNHINVMPCWKNIFFKYLFSYMQKEKTGQHVQGSMFRWASGGDSNTFNWDEVEHFRSMRFFGAYEAIYRIFGIPFTLMSHSVQTLPIHLPSKQLLYYRGEARNVDLGRATSKLEGWFILNREDEYAHRYLYQDIVKEYKWSDKAWVRKEKSNTLGRLLHINPSGMRNDELFHLRLLLLNRRGICDWDELLTVNGKTHGSFTDAAEALGVTGTATFMYAEALGEVVNHAYPNQIRRFFGTLVATCNVQNVADLWLHHRMAMSEDFIRRGMDRHYAFVKCRSTILAIVNSITGGDSSRLASKMTVPICGDDEDDIFEEPLEIVPEECEVDLDAEFDEDEHPILDDGDLNTRIASLTDEQQIVFQTIMNAVLHGHENEEKFFKLQAPGGCGKTHVYRAILEECAQKGIPTIATAFTAIAALLLPDGVTVHRAFGIMTKAKTDGTERSFIEASSVDGMALRAARLIVIDEYSMIAAWQAILIDQLLRSLMEKPDLVFGGKVVLLGGDMGQILPVLKGLSPADVVNECITSWVPYNKATSLSLTRNMRAAGDPEFAEWLMKVRNGDANTLEDRDTILVPDDMLISPAEVRKQTRDNPGHLGRSETSLAHELIKAVYGSMTEDEVDNGVILSPTNDTVRAINDIIMNEYVVGRERTYFSVTKLCLESVGDRVQQQDLELGEFMMAQEELDRVNACNIPPHRLTLKVGSIVMLLVNLDRKRGLCNGTRFRVVKLYDHTIAVRRLVAFRGRKDTFFLPKMNLRTDDVPVAGTIQRFQFPVTPAFAITINKSQGQSIRKVGVYLRRPVFSHGQFYVAVSRASSKENVRIAIVPGVKQGPVARRRGGKGTRSRFKTKNIVYRCVLV